MSGSRIPLLPKLSISPLTPIKEECKAAKQPSDKGTAVVVVDVVVVVLVVVPGATVVVVVVVAVGPLVVVVVVVVVVQFKSTNTPDA